MMTRDLPPLNALKAFEVVGGVGSIRRAAEVLGVSHTAVSRHLRNLEGVLGTKLFYTGPQGVVLTAEGSRLLKGVDAAFDLIRTAVDEIRPTHRRRELRLWCVPGLAARWLMPRLAEMQGALRGVDVVLRPTVAVPNLPRLEADVDIRFGQRLSPGVTSEELAQPRFFPVASPAFLAGIPAMSSIKDIVGLPLIHEDSRDQWRIWLELAGLGAVHMLSGPRVWHADLALEAAVMGQGVALTNIYLAEPDLTAGRLVEIFKTDVRIGGYFFHAATDRWGAPEITKLRRWLRKELNT